MKGVEKAEGAMKFRGDPVLELDADRRETNATGFAAE